MKPKKKTCYNINKMIYFYIYHDEFVKFYDNYFKNYIIKELWLNNRIKVKGV